MGKIVDNEQFIQQLTSMYQLTKKWGTVKVYIKRSIFEPSKGFMSSVRRTVQIQAVKAKRTTKGKRRSIKGSQLAL